MTIKVDVVRTSDYAIELHRDETLATVNGKLAEAAIDAVAVYRLRQGRTLNTSMFGFQVNGAVLAYQLGYFLKNADKITARANEGRYTKSAIITLN